MWRPSPRFVTTLLPSLFVGFALSSLACDDHGLLYDDAVGGGGAGTTSSQSTTASASSSGGGGQGGAGGATGAGGQGGAGGGTCDPCVSSAECAPGACAIDGASGCATCFEVCDGARCQGANTCVSDADCPAPAGRCVCDATGCTICVAAL
jgi:hypothetical protein